MQPGTNEATPHGRSETETERERAIERGQETILAVAERAGLAPGEYDTEVLVGDDVEAAVREVVDESDLVCLGLVSESDLMEESSGSIAEQLQDRVSRNLVIARQSQDPTG